MKMGLLKLNWISNLFKKSNKAQEPKEKKNKILIEYDELSGNFTVETKISDMSDASAEVIAILMFSESVGALTPYFYEALTLWAGTDIEKAEFNNKVAEIIMSLTEESIKGLSKGSPAVRASQVFNIGE